ncbi:MAG: hypothetical protein ACI8Z5_000138 [Lentimonas sp.]
MNLLGLSLQVPAKIVYLTDGAKKTVVVGQQVIQLKPTTPKNMQTAGRVSGLVIQVFRYLCACVDAFALSTNLSEWRRSLADGYFCQITCYRA